MKHINQGCDLQFFVCVNERPENNTLPSCGSRRGHEVFELLKREVMPWASRLGVKVWINRSFRQGFFSEQGVTISVFPLQWRAQAIVAEDIPLILQDLEKQL